MPTPPPIEPSSRHTLGPAGTRAELRILRPDLVPGLDAALPAARAAILSRVLHALHHESLPGVRRGPHGVEFADGRVLISPAGAAQPFTNPGAGLTVQIGPGAPRGGDVRGERAGPEGSRRQRDGRHQAQGNDQAQGDRHAQGNGQAQENWAAQGNDKAGEGGHTYDDPADLLRALDLGPHTARLIREIDNSVANLALAHATPSPVSPFPAAAGDPDGLGRLEQHDRDGHPLHPCARTRTGMTVPDVLAYAPEHRPVIRLRRLAVPPERWYGDAPPVLFAHPWQAERLRDRYPWLTDAGETGPVRPLMSLRTVAPLSGGDHYKTAVDIQMTSAVRTVSPAAVHNGPRLSALLVLLTADLPLTVLRETAAGAVLVDGLPQRHLAHLRREAPRITRTETVVPLGALAPLLPGLTIDPYAWWHDLAHLLFPPLLTVLDRGVALEAHGQNTLLVLDGTRPARIVYRDLGGVRVSARRLHDAGFEAPPIEGDLPSDDPDVLRTKLAAAALGTVAAQLISVLARAGAEPDRLWATTAAALRRSGTADAERLVRDPLPVKATTAMRLADDPLDDIWTHLDNPMAGV